MIRKATHAGSWYSNSATELSSQLESWLSTPQIVPTESSVRALIVPHAGYRYCGETGAYGYKQLTPITNGIKRIFILGPSHHVRLSGCALSNAAKYETPIGTFDIDTDTINHLKTKDGFELMDLNVDENEHSIEMTLGFLKYVFQRNREVKLVPIMVGSLKEERQKYYGDLFAEYLMDPTCLFIISSDFCHWGFRFKFCPTNEDAFPSINACIEDLDREGMKLIEEVDPKRFNRYLHKTGNTICGRNPISILLFSLHRLKHNNKINHMKCQFLKYAQSDSCYDVHDSSVSYATASITF